MAQGMFFFTIFIFKIRIPTVFSPDDCTNTSSSAGDPLDVTRSIIIDIIDRDIARLEESIRALKSRRNDLSPIYRLPVEILCNIFSLSILWTPDSWTNFSQVSRHWRSLALSAANLWTNIPLSYPLWAQEMLIRSKKAKLTIRSGPSYETSKSKTIETIRSCLYEMNRVEEIQISYGIPGLVLEKIFSDLPQSAPQLHTLCIGSCSPYFSENAFSIHENFLYDTERLQRVELINCEISWASPLLTGLTSLTLEVTLEDSLKANSSINQFFHALQRMPALTHLRLKNSIPEYSEGPSTYPAVDLPCLRALNISSSVGALTAALHHITFPNSAVLNLTCEEKQSNEIDFSNFLSVLNTKFMSSLVFRTLCLQILEGSQTHGLEFCLWTFATTHGYFPSILASQSQLRLVLAWPSSRPHNHVNILKALTSAFDVMSLPFLVQLQILTLDLIDSSTWVKTFENSPLLEWLSVRTLRSCATPRLLDALVNKTKGAEKSETAYRNIPLPKLRNIYLEGTDFGGTFPGFSISVDMLLDCLMERCERDAEVLQTLHLNHCYRISSDDVARLKEVVVDVIWDGVEQELEVSTQYDSEEGTDYDHNDGNSFNDLDFDYDNVSLGSMPSY